MAKWQLMVVVNILSKKNIYSFKQLGQKITRSVTWDSSGLWIDSSVRWKTLRRWLFASFSLFFSTSSSLRCSGLTGLFSTFHMVNINAWQCTLISCIFIVLCILILKRRQCFMSSFWAN